MNVMLFYIWQSLKKENDPLWSDEFSLPPSPPPPPPTPILLKTSVESMFYTVCINECNAILHLASLKKENNPLWSDEFSLHPPPSHPPPPILLKTSVESMFYTVCINECNAILHLASLKK